MLEHLDNILLYQRAQQHIHIHSISTVSKIDLAGLQKPSVSCVEYESDDWFDLIFGV